MLAGMFILNIFVSATLKPLLLYKKYQKSWNFISFISLENVQFSSAEQIFYILWMVFLATVNFNFYEVKKIRENVKFSSGFP